MPPSPPVQVLHVSIMSVAVGRYSHSCWHLLSLRGPGPGLTSSRALQDVYLPRHELRLRCFHRLPLQCASSSKGVTWCHAGYVPGCSLVTSARLLETESVRP